MNFKFISEYIFTNYITTTQIKLVQDIKQLDQNNLSSS